MIESAIIFGVTGGMILTFIETMKQSGTFLNKLSQFLVVWLVIGILTFAAYSSVMMIVGMIS